MANQPILEVEEIDFDIGPRAIKAYSRLSYSMWHALAEFIDNSTQSRKNYDSIIDKVLADEGTPLRVEINHNRLTKEITIRDNSIGMTKSDLIAALRLAEPTKDSVGRSKFGLGMKTAACWIGRRWKVITCEWSSGEEWTAEIDVNGIADHNKRIPLSCRSVGADKHYTEIVISDLHRNIQARTEGTIRSYLGSMYRFDLVSGRLRIFYNDVEVVPPENMEWDTDPEGKPLRRDLPEITINGKHVKGWIGVLRKGGRKFGGFSLFQNERQIQGFPKAWKPNTIFGGVADEGANNLIAQRLTGIIELDGFNVSHTKDAILFEDDEEEELENFLIKETKDYKTWALKRRGEKGQPWSKEKIRDMVRSLSKEFTNDEMKDAVSTTMLPPLDTIIANNQQQVASLSQDDNIATYQVSSDLRVVVSMQDRSEFEPYVTLAADAQDGTIHVIINRLHPYYSSQESTDAAEECYRQFIYDAIAEYRVAKLQARVSPDSVRRFKDALLRVQDLRIENAAAREGEDDAGDQSNAAE